MAAVPPRPNDQLLIVPPDEPDAGRPKRGFSRQISVPIAEHRSCDALQSLFSDLPSDSALAPPSSHDALLEEEESPPATSGRTVCHAAVTEVSPGASKNGGGRSRPSGRQANGAARSFAGRRSPTGKRVSAIPAKSPAKPTPQGGSARRADRDTTHGRGSPSELEARSCQSSNASPLATTKEAKSPRQAARRIQQLEAEVRRLKEERAAAMLKTRERQIHGKIDSPKTGRRLTAGPDGKPPRSKGAVAFATETQSRVAKLEEQLETANAQMKALAMELSRSQARIRQLEDDKNKEEELRVFAESELESILAATSQGGAIPQHSAPTCGSANIANVKLGESALNQHFHTTL